MPRDVTIVLSDMHISNGEKYTWFLPPYPAQLTQMLNQIAGDSRVAEVVLLRESVRPLAVSPGRGSVDGGADCRGRPGSDECAAEGGGKRPGCLLTEPES